MAKGMNPTLFAIVNKVHQSQITNLLHGTPVKSVADVIAEEQQKIRQMMLHFGKGGAVNGLPGM